MKRKLLILSSLLVSTNLLSVVACSKSQHDGDSNIIIPDSYNLVSELKELNELDFKDRKPAENLKNYHFLNSWFMNFETTNKNHVLFEGTKVGCETSTSMPKGTITISNCTSLTQTFNAREASWEAIENKNLNKLTSMATIVDLDQDFQIKNKTPDFQFGNKNILTLTKRPKFVDYDETRYYLSKNEYPIESMTTYKYYYELNFHFNNVDGILKFKLNKNTKIAYQIENNITHQKSIYSYTVEKLIDKYYLNKKYQKALSNENGFLYYHEKSNQDFNLQIRAQFKLLDYINNTSYFVKIK